MSEASPRRPGWLIVLGGVIALVLVGGYGYLRSGAHGPPQIEAPPRLYDFGELPPIEKAVVEYRVRNTGGSPLEITRVSTSCGCTTAEIEDEVLLPGETTTLHVTFDPQVMLTEGLTDEEIVRIIYLKTNDPDHPEMEVELRGRVVPTAGGEEP
jgi:hypothetical protein